MGLPIRRLILATNENNILSRFVTRGDYSIGTVVQTSRRRWTSRWPAISSATSTTSSTQDPDRVRAGDGGIPADRETLTSAAGRAEANRQRLSRPGRRSGANPGDDPRIPSRHRRHPRSAHRRRRLCRQQLAGGEAPVVCLATAHAAKFPDAVREAIGRDPEIPPSLAGIAERPSAAARSSTPIRRRSRRSSPPTRYKLSEPGARPASPRPFLIPDISPATPPC